MKLHKIQFRTLILIFFLHCNVNTYAQEHFDYASKLFSEYSIASDKNKNLWPLKLNPPILLLDTQNSVIYTNRAVKHPSIQLIDEVYLIKPDSNLRSQGPFLFWKNTKWIVLDLPYAGTMKEAIAFIAHEAFHLKQDSLGIKGFFLSLPYLSTIEGKYLMYLELMELVRALESSNSIKTRTHLKNALSIRAYKYQLFPKSKEMEKQAELSEGLAEYTGLNYAGYPEKELLEHYSTNIQHLKDKSIEGAYPYLSGSLYAFLNDKISNDWKKAILEKSLSEIGTTIFSIDSIKIISSIEDDFLNEILDLGAFKSIQNNNLQDSLKSYFSHAKLYLDLSNSSVVFKSNLVVSIKGLGTVYNNVIIENDWGKLTVNEEGKVLVSNEDGKIILNAYSMLIDGGSMKGNNWQLVLDEKWKMIKKGSNFYVTEIHEQENK